MRYISLTRLAVDCRRAITSLAIDDLLCNLSPGLCGEHSPTVSNHRISMDLIISYIYIYYGGVLK